MYQTCYWVQRYNSTDPTAYELVDDDFTEIIYADSPRQDLDRFYESTITTAIIDAYTKRGASAAKIAKCLYLAFKGHEHGSSGNTTIKDMIKIAGDHEPRFKDYEEHLKLLLLFS